MTLEINDDGTYKLATRRGAAMRTEAGVVVANGGSVTLRSSSGKSMSLMRRGDVLYGVAPDDRSGYTVHMSIEKDSGALASPR